MFKYDKYFFVVFVFFFNFEKKIYVTKTIVKKTLDSYQDYFILDMAAATDNETRVALFQSIGLNEQKARETLKNQEVTRLLEKTINEV
jgi:hypothetical protein